MKEILKFLAYRVVFPALVLLRVDKLLQLSSSHQRLIIFFHGTSRHKQYRLNGRHMDAAQFEQLIRYLKENFEILSVEELCSREGNVATSRKAIALSFDDGFQNNIDVALPMLEKYRIPATFFISSASPTNPEYLHPSDVVDMLRLKLKTNCVSINGVEFIFKRTGLVSKHEGQTILDYLNSLSLPELKSTIEQILATYGREELTRGIDSECYCLMSAIEISKISSNAMISIASHGHYHVSMPVLSGQEANDQISTSREILERCSGRQINSLAFPYGHFNQAVVEAGESNGIQYFFAGGDVDRSRHKVFPRIGVLSMRGLAYNVLSISRAFDRFGF